MSSLYLETMEMEILPDRKIPIYFKPEQIGQDTFDTIVRWYSIGEVPIRTITRRIQNRRARSKLTAMDHLDVYGVLAYAIKTNPNIHDRLIVNNELRICEFQTLFKCWQRGLKFADCLQVVYSRHKNCEANKRVIQTLSASFNRRRRQCISDVTITAEKAFRGRADQLRHDLLERSEVFKNEKGELILSVNLSSVEKDLIELCMKYLPEVHNLTKPFQMNLINKLVYFQSPIIENKQKKEDEE